MNKYIYNILARTLFQNFNYILLGNKTYIRCESCWPSSEVSRSQHHLSSLFYITLMSSEAEYACWVFLSLIFPLSLRLEAIGSQLYEAQKQLNILKLCFDQTAKYKVITHFINKVSLCEIYHHQKRIYREQDLPCYYCGRLMYSRQWDTERYNLYS